MESARACSLSWRARLPALNTTASARSAAAIRISGQQTRVEDAWPQAQIERCPCAHDAAAAAHRAPLPPRADIRRAADAAKRGLGRHVNRFSSSPQRRVCMQCACAPRSSARPRALRVWRHAAARPPYCVYVYSVRAAPRALRCAALRGSRCAAAAAAAACTAAAPHSSIFSRARATAASNVTFTCSHTVTRSTPARSAQHAPASATATQGFHALHCPPSPCHSHAAHLTHARARAPVTASRSACVADSPPVVCTRMLTTSSLGCGTE